MNAENQKTSTSPARRIAYAGMVTALSVVLLYLLQVLPTMRAAMLFVLSLLPAVLAHERRFADALLCFAASALLSLLLTPVGGPWIMYVGFFGWYGSVREFIVTRWGKAASWAALAVAFNIAFFALYFAFGSLLLQGFALPALLAGFPLLAVLIPAAEVAFVIFELLYGMCRAYYIIHIRKLLYGRPS